MTLPRFIQIHTLTSYPASLLNRDDAGMAKRIPFGGATRTRISSQCLKRHWRRHEGEHQLGDGVKIDLSVRSRGIFEELIAKPLVAEGADEIKIRAVLAALQSELLGKSEKSKAKDKKQEADGEKRVEASLATGQVIVLGRPEIEFIKATALEIARDLTDVKKAGEAVGGFFKDKAKKDNLEALKKSASGGLDAALFGRMVTSDILARGDAAIHVAHAFTTHGEETESDYFTAVDDLVADAGELGSGHLGETELTSGLFYGYVVIDVPQLVSNLEGVARKEWESADRAIAGKVIENMIHLICEVSPGAKLGSTAPYAFAELCLVEAGTRQPRTLANAFREPSAPSVFSAVRALGDYYARFEKMYGKIGEARFASLHEFAAEGVQSGGSLADLATWAANSIRG
jgi:CRISPR system Cascade subunit CasC